MSKRYLHRRFVTDLLFALLCFSMTSCVATKEAQKQQSNFVTIGNEYARDGLYREAIDQYRRALAENPENFSARRNIGVVSVRIGDYKNAIRNLEQIVTRFADNFDTNFYLAEAYRAEENYAQAIFYYQSALRIRKDEPRAMKSLAWSYYKIRYFSESLAITEKLKEITKDDLQVVIIHARTLIKLNQHRQALAEIRRAKQNASKENQAFLQSIEGDSHAAMGRCEHAMQLYRNALRQDPTLAGALLGLGKCHLEAGRSDRGIAYIERAVRIRPNMAEAYFTLGQALETADAKRSAQYYRLFLKHGGSDPEYISLTTEARGKLSQLMKSQNNSK